MVMPVDRFRHHYTPDKDIYYNEVPLLVLDNLKPRYDVTPVISVMISTYNRQSQLQRSLECYARQTYRDFEILLNDDGSTQDIKAIVDKFSPFLNITYFHTPRTSWVSCPSKAFAMLYPHTRGKVLVAVHPEIMFSNDAMQFIYDVLIENKKENCNSYVLDAPNFVGDGNNPWTWVSLRPNFFDRDSQMRLNMWPWHENVDDIQKMSGWKEVEGFAGRKNWKHDKVPGYPWWFVGAALKECPIWEDTPISEGHGIIDMYWCWYRKNNNFLDVVPNKVMCYHQLHQVSAIAPEGEQDAIIPRQNLAKCAYDW